MPRQNGFTLLEMMMVLLLLSIIALGTIATLPAASTRPQAEKLLVMIRQAIGQPQLDGGVIRLQVSQQQATLFRLAAGHSEGETPFPGHHWQPLGKRLGQLDLPEPGQLSLIVAGRTVPLPASLLFLADGSQPAFTLRISSPGLRATRITARSGEAVLSESP